VSWKPGDYSFQQKFQAPKKQIPGPDRFNAGSIYRPISIPETDGEIHHTRRTRAGSNKFQFPKYKIYQLFIIHFSLFILGRNLQSPKGSDIINII